MTRLLLGSVALLLVTGCAKPEPPKIEPRSIQLVSLLPTKLSVEMDATNPNSYPLIVQSVKGRLSLGAAKNVADGTVDQKISIPAKATTRVTSEIQVNWAGIVVPPDVMTPSKAVPYTFQGTASVGAKSVNFDVPFEMKGEFTHAQLINSAAKGLGLPNITLPQ
jgi:LEA14-like dessication related protein